jgi:steroid Delta-isomerase
VLEPLADQITETIRRYYKLVDQGDVDGLLGLFADRAIYQRPGYAPIVGRSQLVEFYANQRVISTGEHAVVKILVDAGNVAVEGTFAGRLKDGSEVGLRFADFFVVDDSLHIKARNTYFFTPMV